MIQANELRIGNWVGHLIMPNMKVAGIAQVCVDLEHPELKRDYWDAFIDDLVGIPLTEEWLLKFGFEKKEDGVKGGINALLISYKLDGYDFMQDNSGKWFLCGYNWNTKHFKHVHQLQNLYFALTGQELEIK